LVILSVCFLLAGADAALAKSLPRFRSLAHAVTMPFADGSRYVAFALSSTRARVVDTKTGGGFEEPVPTSAAGAPCVLQGTGGGFLLWACLTADPQTSTTFVQQISTRRFEPVTGLDQLRSNPPVAPDQVGRFWISSLQTSGRGTLNRVYLNWHTGEFHQDPGVTAFQDRHVVDLNRADMAQPLCRPLRRPSFPDNSANGFPMYGPFAYDAPYAVTSLVEGGDLLLQRCGQARRVRLSRCTTRIPASCSPAVPGSGRFTWRTLSSVNGYVPATKHSYVWSFAAAGVPSSHRFDLVQTHTATRIVIAYPGSSRTRWTIRSVPWPDRVR
jgi:hypothetical protein